VLRNHDSISEASFPTEDIKYRQLQLLDLQYKTHSNFALSHPSRNAIQLLASLFAVASIAFENFIIRRKKKGSLITEPAA